MMGFKIPISRKREMGVKIINIIWKNVMFFLEFGMDDQSQN